MSLLVQVFYWSTKYTLSIFQWGQRSSLESIPTLKELVTSGASRFADITRIRQVFSILGKGDSHHLFAFQIGILGSALVFLVLSRNRVSINTLKQDSWRAVWVVSFSIIALVSLGITIVGFPPQYITSDVSSFSELSCEPIRLSNSETAELTIAIPRKSAVKSASLVLASTVVPTQSTLLGSEKKSESQGFPVSREFSSAFSFILNSTHPIGGFSLLISNLDGHADELQLTGFSDQNGRPGGDPLFTLSVTPVDFGLQAQWLDFHFNDPFLAFGGIKTWVVLTTEKGGYHMWWMCDGLDGDGLDGDDLTLVKKMGEGWTGIRATPCIKVLGISDYSNKIHVESGRIKDYWSGWIPASGSVKIDLKEALVDYLPRSPENFKIIQVPLKFSSSSRTEVMVSRMDLIVEETNPMMVYALLSLVVAILVGIVCTYSIWKLLAFEQRPSNDFPESSLVHHRPQSHFESIE